MVIYLVRHAQQQVSPEGEDGGITRLGRSQSRAASQKLKSMGIKVLMSSDLPRAIETAEILEGALGLKAKVLPNLHEIQTPKNAWVEYEAHHHPDFTFHPGGGESVNELLKRVEIAWGEILKTARNRPAVVVCHAIFIKALLYHLGFKEYLLRNDVIANTGITILEVKDGDVALKSFNSYSHLNWLPLKERWMRIKGW